MPGDLHKLWRARDPKSYHVEYGYSCMGYEIPGGMGVKLAAPDREVFVMIGDGSYLMMPGELATAVAEGIKIVVVLVDNHGYASIGALSRSVGDSGFGTKYAPSEGDARAANAEDAAAPPVDLAANAESLGARVLRTHSIAEFREALGGQGGRGARRRARRGRPLCRGAELRELVGRARGRGLDRGVGAGGARGVRARTARAAPVR